MPQFEDVVIHFPKGLIGIPEAKDFQFFEPIDAYPLKFLQSLEHPQLSFIAMDVAAIKMDYSAPLGQEEAEILQLEAPGDALVMAFVAMPDDSSPREMVANLAGPIIVNRHSRRGVQLALDESEYPLQHPVFDLSVHFPAGLVGFRDLKRFRMFEPAGAYPFKFLQAVQDEDYSFVCIDVGAIRPDFDLPLSKDDAEFLSAEKHDDVMVLAIVVIPEDAPRLMTANLAGPLVINKALLKGRQLVLDSEKYPLKYRILNG
jgi:flagellar assembly factor FliW